MFEHEFNSCDSHFESECEGQKQMNTLNADLNVPVFCLSFGRFADSGLLKTLSLQNYAFTRKIYSASDASLQLEGFYKEVMCRIWKMRIPFKSEKLSQIEFYMVCLW